jgi:urease accessory protein
MLAETVDVRCWRAELELRYERRGARSVLASRRHDGPLVVQKPLYPEGDAVCHALVVHPPAGIAGGDELSLDVRAEDAAHALLTTPGAAKWYRSAGPWAHQQVKLSAGKGACIEWLPQETILFDRSLASMRTGVALDADARYLGWDILCLGRTGSGERYAAGRCRLASDITCAGVPLWRERGELDLASAVALGGRSVCGTLFAVGPVSDELLAACREGRKGEVTRLPQLLVARYLGDSSEAARAWFASLWKLLRPAIAGREAVEPRIWRT